MVTAAAALLALLALSVQGYENGAPTTQCESLATGHGQKSQDATTSPYTIKVSSVGVGPGVGVSVELVGGAQRPFLGFLAQARDINTDKPVGYFTLPQGSAAKYLACNSVTQSAITHTNNEAKFSVKAVWQSASSYEGSVRIYATMVQDFPTYWARLPSQTIQVSKSFGGAVAGENLPQPGPLASATTASGLLSQQVYAGCDAKKTCFGTPPNCVLTASCDYVVTWTYAGNNTMVWEAFNAADTGYVAVGISKDTKMGDDLVMACTDNGVQQYYNQGKSPVMTRPNPASLLLQAKTQLDGALYCRFTSSVNLNGGSSVFNLSGGQYFPLIAGGSISSGSIQFHDSRLAADAAVSFTVVAAVGAASDLLMRFHGFIMMAAWLGCAGTGMTIARYFKGTWKGKQVLGKDLWFAAHVTLMVLTVLLNLLAIILICSDVGAWPYHAQSIRNNPHPATGVATVILAFIQPIMAAFRPHPGTRYRPIFNWAHWFVGNSAFILGLASIFLAGYLSRVQGINRGGYLACLIVYVVLHFITNILLSTLALLLDRKEKKAEIHPLTGKGSPGPPPVAPPPPGSDKRGSALRQVILLIYITGVAAIVIAIACLIFLFT